MNDYYDVSIKEYGLKEIEIEQKKHPESIWTFIKGSIADRDLIDRIFRDYKPAVVVNLATQVGVRILLYIEFNLIGFYNIFDIFRHSYDNGETGVEHLAYTSLSSV